VGGSSPDNEGQEVAGEYRRAVAAAEHRDPAGHLDEAQQTINATRTQAS
jgi:hypothetical protein